MTREKIAVATQAFEAWNRGGVDALLPLLHPDVEWRDRVDFPEATSQRGREAVRRHLEEYGDVLDEIRWAVGQSTEVDGYVITAARLTTRGRSSGAETTLPLWVVSAVRDGLITQRCSFGSEEEALEWVARSH